MSNLNYFLYEALYGLTDVVISSPANNNILKYQSSNNSWINSNDVILSSITTTTLFESQGSLLIKNQGTGLLNILDNTSGVISLTDPLTFVWDGTNLGSGEQIFKSKNIANGNLEFRTLIPGYNLSATTTSDSVQLDVDISCGNIYYRDDGGGYTLSFPAINTWYKMTPIFVKNPLCNNFDLAPSSAALVYTGTVSKKAIVSLTLSTKIGSGSRIFGFAIAINGNIVDESVIADTIANSNQETSGIHCIVTLNNNDYVTAWARIVASPTPITFSTINMMICSL